jgi:hypothetical protein
MSLCPFFKDICKGNQCMMWKDDNCLFTIFLQGGLFADEQEEEGIISVSDGISGHSIPEYFKSISAEDIASECIEFIRKEFPESTHRPFGVFDLFLQSKGLDRSYGIPLEINLKVSKARILVEQENSKLFDEEQRVRIEKEKSELPSLVDRFNYWLEDKELNKVRLIDVNRFATENNLDLLSGTIRDIYDISQSRMEEKHKQKILKEKKEIPNVVDQCVDWARTTGLKTVSKSDIETFVIEKQYELTKETQKSVYALVNTKLKSKK